MERGARGRSKRCKVFQHWCDDEPAVHHVPERQNRYSLRSLCGGMSVRSLLIGGRACFSIDDSTHYSSFLEVKTCHMRVSPPRAPSSLLHAQICAGNRVNDFRHLTSLRLLEHMLRFPQPADAIYGELAVRPQQRQSGLMLPRWGDSIVKSHGCVLSQCQVVQLMTRYPPSPQMQGTIQGTCPSISSSHQGSHTLICYFSMERQYPHNIKKFMAYFGCMVRTEHTRDEHGETDNDHWHS